MDDVTHAPTTWHRFKGRARARVRVRVRAGRRGIGLGLGLGIGIGIGIHGARVKGFAARHLAGARSAAKERGAWLGFGFGL